jgi:hypothetical protein
MVTGVEEKLKHFCTHTTILECLGRLVAESEVYVCDYCSKGSGLWEKQHRFEFLDHRFRTCDGRMQAIEDALISVTVKDFWNGVHPLPEMSKEGVFKNLKQSGDPSREGGKEDEWERRLPGDKWQGLQKSVGTPGFRELSVFSLEELQDIPLVEDEVEMSELKDIEGEAEASDSTESFKPVWMDRNVNIPCLRPVRESQDVVVGKEEEERKPGGILLQALELSTLKQEADMGLKHEGGESGEKEKVPPKRLPGLIGLTVPKQEVNEDILKPKVEEMEETKNLCCMINRGHMRFEIPGARFPGTPSNCLNCAMQDYGAGRLRGARPGYNCEMVTRDITSNTGSRLRLLDGGVDHGIPQGCYANHRKTVDGWQVMVHTIYWEGSNDAVRWEPEGLMNKLMETLKEGYMVPDGAILDPLGVLEETKTRSDIKNNRPMGWNGSQM